MRSSFTITSPDAPSVVRNRLAAALTSKSAWLPRTTTFRGEVWSDSFRITRNFARLEHAMPLIATGRFAPENEGTRIHVTTCSRWWAWLGTLVWSTLCVDILWQRLVSDPRPGGIHWGEIAVLVGFLLFGWAIHVVGYVFERDEYQRALAGIAAPVAEAT